MQIVMTGINSKCDSAAAIRARLVEKMEGGAEVPILQICEEVAKEFNLKFTYNGGALGTTKHYNVLLFSAL